ncbi:cytosolic 5'-nucleotidase 1A isoform X1 [Prinia subflava]|uniref:cytosolic 5'-nucleotidase 1A isoform X1 n=1 Tax=Prinia subflava TaxID=208062 RepID=UPI002FE3D372
MEPPGPAGAPGRPWDEAKAFYDNLAPKKKPKSPKPENAITIAVSSRALFRMEEEQKIYAEQGVEAYVKYQLDHENEPFLPGAAFPFVKALEAVNAQLRELYPDSEELFDIVLMTNNHAQVGVRLINSINHYDLFIERFCMTGGNSPICYLKAYHTNLYLSSDSEKPQQGPGGVGEAAAGGVRRRRRALLGRVGADREGSRAGHVLRAREGAREQAPGTGSPEGFPGGAGEAAEEILLQGAAAGVPHPHVPGDGAQRGQLGRPRPKDSAQLGPGDGRGSVPGGGSQGSPAQEDSSPHLLRRPDVPRGGRAGDGRRGGARALRRGTEAPEAGGGEAAEPQQQIEGWERGKIPTWIPSTPLLQLVVGAGGHRPPVRGREGSLGASARGGVVALSLLLVGLLWLCPCSSWGCCGFVPAPRGAVVALSLLLVGLLWLCPCSSRGWRLLGARGGFSSSFVLQAKPLEDGSALCGIFVPGRFNLFI